MWSRKELKDRAKSVLKNIYWSAFGVSLVIALAVGGNGWHSGDHSHSHSSNNFIHNYVNDHFVYWDFVALSLVAFIIIVLLHIFIGYALEVGGRRYFVQSAQYKDNKKSFSFAFDEQNYMNIVKTMLVKNIYIFLWGLLLIIPGIIKAYAYSMVPYILADNPNIGVREAIKLSNEMTMGHKLDMFILDLSFIGWYLLGSLAFGLGIFFVMPYENATNAELYLVLRRNALDNNLCSYEDLSLSQSIL